MNLEGFFLTNKDALHDASELWGSFKDEVLYKNRFIISHEVLDYITNLSENHKTIIESERVLYRARLFDGDVSAVRHLNDLAKNDENNSGNSSFTLEHAFFLQHYNLKRDPGFWGYNKQESFIPLKNDFINDGRANPAFIKYLYTAEDAYTAMVEVRPYLKSVVSIAEIRVNSPITVADFSYESLKDLQSVGEILMYLIMNDFSKPANSDKKSYIPTQYVAEFIKTLGLDGIRFNSSLHGQGRNITIFDYKDCEPVSSSLYEIDDICFEAKNIAPKGLPDLLHDKLLMARQKEVDNILKRN
ncbi:RES family NAD+ phosphorylase [Paenibacillus sp. Soil522]|uniref:RES family NAD+ phosphorylase n=1 Tax=Paenibacillus sp. Soil522 TaxID=1736388 RepID=UPI0006FCE6AF|nr:RES family NAD+ phosphorylase [Paenibacillus sp. Soil522]KRE45819.1 hypothetical protein ASG81_12380 [Paenibacillus sp. Soil522]